MHLAVGGGETLARQADILDRGACYLLAEGFQVFCDLFSEAEIGGQVVNSGGYFFGLCHVVSPLLRIYVCELHRTRQLQRRERLCGLRVRL